MKILIFTICTLFFFYSCDTTSVNEGASENFVGLWKTDTRILEFDSLDNRDTVFALYEIMPNNRFVSTTTSDVTFYELTNTPNLTGEWSFDPSTNKIKFFRGATDVNIIFPYELYWEITSISDTRLTVNVYDKTEWIKADTLFRQ